MSVLRCIEAFSVMEGNVPRVVRGGDVVDSDDSVVKGHESMFEPLEDHFNRARAVRAGEATETATAGPGEKRSAPSRRTTAAKAAAKRRRTQAKKAAPAKKAAAKKAPAKAADEG